MTGAERVAVRTVYWRLQDMLTWLGETRPQDERLDNVLYELYCDLLDARKELAGAIDIKEVPPCQPPQ